MFYLCRTEKKKQELLAIWQGKIGNQYFCYFWINLFLEAERKKKTRKVSFVRVSSLLQKSRWNFVSKIIVFKCRTVSSNHLFPFLPLLSFHQELSFKVYTKEPKVMSYTLRASHGSLWLNLYDMPNKQKIRNLTFSRRYVWAAYK